MLTPINRVFERLVRCTKSGRSQLLGFVRGCPVSKQINIMVFQTV